MDVVWFQKKKASLEIIQARRIKNTSNRSMVFGGLAIVVTLVTLDPLALRPRFSPGLPLSDFFFWSHCIVFLSFCS
jgi:hypothetical protein